MITRNGQKTNGKGESCAIISLKQMNHYLIKYAVEENPAFFFQQYKILDMQLNQFSLDYIISDRVLNHFLNMILLDISFYHFNVSFIVFKDVGKLLLWM